MNGIETLSPGQLEWQKEQEANASRYLSICHELSRISLEQNPDSAQIASLAISAEDLRPDFAKTKYDEIVHRQAGSLPYIKPLLSLSEAGQRISKHPDISLAIGASELRQATEMNQIFLDPFLFSITKEEIQEFDEDMLIDVIRLVNAGLRSINIHSTTQTLEMYSLLRDALLARATALSSEQAETLVREVDDFSKTDEFKETYIQEISRYVGTEQNFRGRQFIVDILAEFGLDFDDLLKIWKDAADGVPPITSEITSIIELEHSRPGITKVLREEFGIKLFSFFPKDALIDQFDQKDDVEKPYGIVIVATHGHLRDYFGLPKMVEQWHGLHQAVKEHQHLRFLQMSTKYEAGRLLASLNNRYQAAGTIKFGFGMAHGAKDLMILGPDLTRRGMFHTKDFRRERYQRAGSFFADKAPIILVACSTGQEDGIGQEISRGLGCRLIAPVEPCALETLGVSYNESEDPEFSLSYAGKNGKKVGYNIYENGELVGNG